MQEFVNKDVPICGRFDIFLFITKYYQSFSYRIIFETGVPIGVIVGQVIAFHLTEGVALISMSAKNMQTYA